MSTSNPNDDYLLEQIRALREALQANPGRSTAIERGITEFYDQSMLIIRDSNMRVVGIAYVEGRLEGEGTLSWSGPALLDGPVEITDTLDVLAATRLRGETTIEGLARLLSELIVEGGKITAGGVRIENNKLYVGDAMVFDPATDGGAVLFSNGAKMYSNTTAIGMRNGSSSVTIGDTLAAMLVGGKAFTITDERMSLQGVRVTTDPGEVDMYLGLTTSKEIVAISSAIGGPGGSLSWPFPPSSVTSEYGPREVTIEGASAFHEGIDFGAAEGTAIPSAGAGRVTFAGPNGGYGNHVRIDHGRGLVTTYSHMATMPRVSVGQIVPTGYDLGPVGDTGVSGEPHLHFEVQVNGSPVNPRSKLPAA